jgi:tetratricopeptide (TPR) repeat protein
MKKRAEPSGDVSPFIHLEETFKYLWADFSSEPKDVALCFPFVVGILPHRVEVYSLYASASNAVEDKGKNNVPVWHHALDAELCCASSKRFYVVDAKNNVFYFTPPSIDAQIKQLQGDFHIAQAQHLFAKRFEGANTKVKNQKLAEMQDNAAYSYLFRARFREAFEYMYKARKTSYEHRKDVRHVLQFFKDCSIMVGDQKIYPLIPSEFFVGFESGKKSMYGSMLSIQERLTNAINKTIPKNNSDISDSAWVEVLIGKALNNLIDFLEKVLEDMRQEKKKSESEQVQQACVEYLLIALYLRHVEGDPVSYNRIETTINHDNNCFNFDSTLRDKFVVLLKQANCYRHVALLIKSAGAGYYMPALNTLQKWIEKDIYYDVHNGVNDAIDILVRIDGPELMLDEVKPFISWIINQNPIKAVRIFTTPRKTMPDPVKVLEFLRAYPLSLKEKYLHYLLKVENSNEPAHHTDYAMTLIENILKLLPSKGGIYEAASNPRVRVKAQAPRDLLIGEYRNSLIEHLQESDVYDASTVLSRLEETVLFEELVTLYEKINQHKNALETIIFNLEEGDYAEDYCDRVHTNDLIRMEERHQVPDSNYNPYLVLLAETCVRPRGTYSEEKMNKSLLIMKDILNRRASDIDPIEVLRVLPDDIPASAIEGFLEQSIQYTHHRERTSKIKNRLSRNANMQVRSKHLKATSRKVIVHTHTVCPVCDQTIENAVFAVFPDLSVIHYRCLTSANSKKERMLKSTTVHPKTMLNYDRFPVDF